VRFEKNLNKNLMRLIRIEIIEDIY